MNKPHRFHNLGTVIRFEVTRMLKKPSFWLVALGFPVLMAGIFAIVFWSNVATSEAVDKLKDEKTTILVTDLSGTIKPDVLDAFGAHTIDSKEDGLSQVKAGQVDGFIYVPKDLAKDGVQVYGKDAGMFANGKYSVIAKAMLDQSVDTQISQQQQAVLRDKVNISTTTYRDGVVYDGIKEMIAPGIFLVLFYLLIAFFGNQMLSSTIEEKENRTIEMLLTTIQSRVLIAGKILSLICLAFIQGLLILLPILIMYFVLAPQLQMPNIDLTSIPIDPLRISLGALIFFFSFLLFTGLLVALGAAMPTAKEASQWFGLIMILIFGPLYGVTAFISYPDSPFVQFLSLFPLTSPIPLMLRNAYGNLPLSEAIIGIVILGVSSVLALLLAVKIFRYGAMQYDSKISLSALRAKRSK